VAINIIIPNSKLNKLLHFIFFSFILSSCANIVSPSGGPQDKTPPKVVKCIPNQNETNFKNKEIVIDFDEHIVIKDINNQLFISPPLENKPEVKIKGKSIIIKLNEDLIPQTTYLFNFGEAITDLHEGNPLSNFTLVFSTGNTVDSMSYSGCVIDAYTSEPEKEAIVLLYENSYDSVPYLEKPLYISKTDSKGNFTFNNIKNSPLKIVAINDLNKNLKYNPYVEKIAFETDLITPLFIPPKNTDTSSIDNIKVKTSTNDIFGSNLMRVFLETSSQQRVLKSSFLTENQVIITFQKAVKNIEINKTTLPDNQYIQDWNNAHDTMYLWLLNPQIDSIKIYISDNSKFSDSILICKTKLTKKIPQSYTINLTHNITPIFDYFNKINISFPYPVLKTDSLKLTLIENLDTIKFNAFRLNKSYRTYIVDRQLKQNTDYNLIIENHEIEDINTKNIVNLNAKFKTNSSDDFGNLTFDFIPKDTLNFHIIEIVNEKNQIIEEVLVKGIKKLKFKNLKPGNYYAKAIVDKNRNNKWDTGNYLLKIQPEKTFIFPSKINIKANWDVEEKWYE